MASKTYTMPLMVKWLIPGGITLAGVILLSLQPAIPQNQAFHSFADHRDWMGLHNAWNVLSNIPFVIIGCLGIRAVLRSPIDGPVRRAYIVLFAGILLTGIGSAYYHSSLTDQSLVFDRIPMTIVFMGFLSIVIQEWTDPTLGTWLLVPLLILGITSVCWWYFTESIGKGDLRLYLFVQFYPMVIIPVIFLLFNGEGKARKLGLLIGVIGWYVVAKFLEHFDVVIFERIGWVSGHSLKHLAAALSTLYLLLFFKARYNYLRII